MIHVRRAFPVLEAMQWDGENTTAVIEWAQGGWKVGGIWLRQRFEDGATEPSWALVLPEGDVAYPGDYIVKRNGKPFAVSAERMGLDYEIVPT